MSLVKYEDKKVVPSSGNIGKTKDTRLKIPSDVKRPVIDYETLNQLISIDGLQDRHNSKSSAEAHKKFMDNYRKIFVQPEQLKGLPVHSVQRSMQKSTGTSHSGKSSKSAVAGNPSSDQKPPKGGNVHVEEEESHDIREHMAKLHKQRKSEDPEAIQADRIKMLRKLLKKLPFERTASENDQIYTAARHFPELAVQMPANVLKELSVVAQMDAWKDSDITIFGNTGFHVILKGSAQAKTIPYMRLHGKEVDIPCPTPEPEEFGDLPILRVGDCFGTLDKLEDRDTNSRVLTVSTLEPCEFMKITTSDYKRVIEQIRHREQTEKVNLIQSCSGYKTWSKQPLIKVASLLQNVTFPPNTVLVSEGYKAPFMAIVKTGECHVLRHVEVLKELPNGKKERKTKQVVMGKLGPCDSFGEISIILSEAITCSIVTATQVELACIEPHKLRELDETTLQLLQHSNEPTFGNLTQEDIHEEYVQQEIKREWNEFKHNAVVDVINSRGIQPGYGKWSKE